MDSVVRKYRRKVSNFPTEGVLNDYILLQYCTFLRKVICNIIYYPILIMCEICSEIQSSLFMGMSDYLSYEMG